MPFWDVLRDNDFDITTLTLAPMEGGGEQIFFNNVSLHAKI